MISNLLPTYPAHALLAALCSFGALAGAVELNENQPPTPGIYVREYRVEGAKRLPRIDVERAVYPFLGPERTETDVENARKALEKAYRDAGYQAVAVQIPPQDARNGIVILNVIENPVGRLRVRSARYYLPSEIKRRAPSLREGTVLDFNEVSRDIVALNQQADLRVIPSLRPGVEADTVDLDLEVQDRRPLHGSLELNNRYSADTTHLRLNGSISYANLWQLGHTAGASFQIAPEDVGEVKVFSGYYLARFASAPNVSLLLQGTKQDSNVSTLGGMAVAGKGEYFGPHLIFTLPGDGAFAHSLNAGIDYKHFDQNVVAGSVETPTPISYYPINVSYSASWGRQGALTEFNAGVNLHLRGMGSGQGQFDDSRYEAQGNYIYLRGDAAHTRDLPAGFQLFGKVQGQISDQPLINSEQFAAGGLTTVRGYVESAVLGDNALCGSIELRTPSLASWNVLAGRISEWRFYVFADGGVVTLRQTLPEQDSSFKLASYGAGSRMRIGEHFNGSVDLGLPLSGSGGVSPGDLLLTFRMWADF